MSTRTARWLLLTLLLNPIMLARVSLTRSDYRSPVGSVVYRLNGGVIEYLESSEGTWSRITTIDNVKFLAWDDRAPTTLVVYTSNQRIAVSNDAGAHWITRLLLPSGFVAETLEFDALHRNIVRLEGITSSPESGRYPERWRSVNGGRDWVHEISVDQR